jgi:hypothetical protein
VLLFLPPPAVPALAIPPPSTSGRCPERPPRRPIKHAGATRRSASGCVISPLPSSSFLQPCGAIKVDQAPFSPVALPLLLSPTPNRRRRFPPEFSSAAPFRPNPLSPRLPYLLPLLPSWIWASPGHPPRRNRLTPSHPSPAPPSSASSSTAHTAASSSNPRMEIASPLLPGARACVTSPCSPTLRRERRRYAAPPRRRQDFPSASRTPPCPTCSPPPAGHAWPVLPRRRPRRRWEHAGADGRSPSGAGRGRFVRVLIFPGTRAQNPDPPPLGCFCYFMCVCFLSCKIHRKSQKNPKIAKLVLLKTRFQVLQLLFMKFDMKLNNVASILTPRLKGN